MELEKLRFATKLDARSAGSRYRPIHWPSNGWEQSVRIVSSYRTRAIGFEKLAKQTRDEDIKQRLTELSRTCMAVADAIERNPQLVEFEEFATRH